MVSILEAMTGIKRPCAEVILNEVSAQYDLYTKGVNCTAYEAMGVH